MCIHLVILSARADAGAPADLISVWVKEADANAAAARARATMTEQGYTVDSIEMATPTTADDYFRRCPSREAFERAQIEGIAWRLPA